GWVGKLMVAGLVVMATVASADEPSRPLMGKPARPTQVRDQVKLGEPAVKPVAEAPCPGDGCTTGEPVMAVGSLEPLKPQKRSHKAKRTHHKKAKVKKSKK
ncbi:MAG: hypothetical protein ABUL72_01515, partial [Armatimonadota bacterium]